MRTGGCQCGEVRYESAGEPRALYVCHCRECRKQSASAFGMSLEVPSAGLRVTHSERPKWQYVMDHWFGRSDMTELTRLRIVERIRHYFTARAPGCSHSPQTEVRRTTHGSPVNAASA